MINKINFCKTLFLLKLFFRWQFLHLDIQKPVGKEIKMPILFDPKAQAEKEAYKFGCEGAH